MLLRRIATLFITFLILFADSGQMIYAHTCFKSNHTYFSLYTPDHCCSKEKVTKNCCAKKAVETKKSCALGKMSCCSVSAKYVKQSFPNNEIKITATKIIKDVITEVTSFTMNIFSSFDKLPSFSSPLLLRCKNDIRFTQVFRI